MSTIVLVRSRSEGYPTTSTTATMGSTKMTDAIRIWTRESAILNLSITSILSIVVILVKMDLE